jgi:hypothetical protein
MVNEKDWLRENKYRYEIKIRHLDNTDANKLFNDAILAIRTLSHA